MKKRINLRFHFEKQKNNGWGLFNATGTNRVFVYTSFRKLWGRLERIIREQKITNADIEIIDKEK